MDAAVDRSRDELTAKVEVARMGYVFATNTKAYARWRRTVDRQVKRAIGLTGTALESAVMNVARMFPKNVIREAR